MFSKRLCCCCPSLANDCPKSVLFLFVCFVVFFLSHLSVAKTCQDKYFDDRRVQGIKWFSISNAITAQTTIIILRMTTVPPPLPDSFSSWHINVSLKLSPEGQAHPDPRLISYLSKHVFIGWQRHVGFPQQQTEEEEKGGLLFPGWR